MIILVLQVAFFMATAVEMKTIDKKLNQFRPASLFSIYSLFSSSYLLGSTGTEVPRYDGYRGTPNLIYIINARVINSQDLLCFLT